MFNKIRDFMLSILLPRKMYRFSNLHIFYSAIILISTALIILFGANLSTEKFARSSIDYPDFTKESYSLVSKEDYKNFPEYKIAVTNAGGYYLDVLVGTEPSDTYQNVIQRTLINEDGNEMEITVVFDEACDIYKSEDPNLGVDKNLFDLNAYMMQYRDDSRNDIDKEYVLFIFTKKSFYYLYNLGQTQDAYGDWTDNYNRSYAAYEKTEIGEDKYFIPTTIDEANAKDIYGNPDISKWTTETTKDNSIIFGDETYKAQKRISDRIQYAIYNGEYIYSNLDLTNINENEKNANFYFNSNVKSSINELIEVMIASDASILKARNSIMAIVINVVVSFVWVLITWLLSRKFVMNKFKEYYAICAISYIPVSIIGCILSIFVRFENLMFFLLVAELLYYIFVTFRINTNPKLLEEDDNDNNKYNKPITPFKKAQKPEVEFQKIKSEDSFYVE